MSLLDYEKYPERVTGMHAIRRVHLCFRWREIAEMRRYIGNDVYDDINNFSQVGVILKLCERGFFFETSKILGALLSNVLQTSMPHELWVLADGRPIRFSLHEFEHMTHLKCGMYDGADEDLCYGDMWTELGLNKSRGPSWNELDDMLKICRGWSFAKRKIVGLLVVMHAGIFGLRTYGRIPINMARLVMDPERFERFPWGRVAFGALMSSISLRYEYRGRAKLLHGLSPVLVVWALEHIPCVGVSFGIKRGGDIPLLQWQTRSSRGLPLEDVFEAEKDSSADRKVRVVHLLEKPYEEIYPEWPGDRVDPKVDRMIRDILGGELDEVFWEARSELLRGLVRGLVRGRPMRNIVRWEARRSQTGRTQG